jgi:hypothetical protein
MNLYTNNKVSEKLATSISGNFFLHYCDNGGEKLVESSSAPLSEPENTERTACTEQQHHFWGISLQTNKNVLDGGHEFSTTAYNQSA